LFRPDLFSAAPFQRIAIGSSSDAAPGAEDAGTEIEAATEAVENSRDNPLEDEAQDPAAGGSSEQLIQPGTWLLATQLVDITKVDPLDTSFRINRNGVGDFETNSICISGASAQAPANIAFPMQPGMGCTVSSFSMSGGNYRSTMSCNFPQYGGRRQVVSSGSYSNIGLEIIALVRVPAEVVVGEFEEVPEIVMHYRITGNLGGAC
jgi:hypothetical protein